jgi:hypothetical protein
METKLIRSGYDTISLVKEPGSMNGHQGNGRGKDKQYFPGAKSQLKQEKKN